MATTTSTRSTSTEGTYSAWRTRRRTISIHWTSNCASLAFDRPVDGNYDVYVLDSASGTTTRVTSSVENDSDPVWLPGDSRIAFTSLRDGHHEIYVTTLDGADAENLTHSFPDDDFEPAAWVAREDPQLL